MPLIFLMIFCSVSAWGSDYLQQGKRLAENNLSLQKESNAERDSLKEQLSLINSSKKQNASSEIQTKCRLGKLINECETNLYVFISFSLSEETLLTLANEIEKLGGIFVIKGLPDNSFQKLAKKLYSLRMKGLKIPITLNPKLFSQYQVSQVPCFVVTEEHRFDKITGNISLDFALKKMADEGETLVAKTMLRR